MYFQIERGINDKKTNTAIKLKVFFNFLIFLEQRKIKQIFAIWQLGL